MSHRPPKFTEADIARAVRAYRKEGIGTRVVICPDGSTIIEPVASAPAKYVADDQPAKEINL